MGAMRFVITGLGVVSPIGNGRDAFWDALIAGRSGIEEIRSFDTSAYRTHRGGEVRALEPARYFQSARIPSLARGALFAIAATRMAIEDADLNAGRMELAEVGVCCGTTMGESQLLESMNATLLNERQDELDREMAAHYSAESIPANVAREFGFGGPIRLVTTACSAGNYAIGQACDLLRSGRANIVIA